MISRKNLWFLILAMVSGVAGAVFLVFLGNQLGKDSMQKLELDEPIIYDSELLEDIISMPQKELSVVFYTAERSKLIENLDYNRNIRVKCIGIAGSSGVLFPEENVLLPGEEGYCLLGKKVAVELFGTTDIVGRSVEIAGKAYQIAGILYQKENYCVYEADRADKIQMEYAAYRFGQKREKAGIEQKLESLYGIRGTSMKP